jgi:hypothetical protein
LRLALAMEATRVVVFVLVGVVLGVVTPGAGIAVGAGVAVGETVAEVTRVEAGLEAPAPPSAASLLFRFFHRKFGL